MCVSALRIRTQSSKWILWRNPDANRFPRKSLPVSSGSDLGRRSAFVRSGGGNVLIVLKLARSLKNLTPCEYMAKQNQDVYIDLAAVNLLNGHPKSVIAMQ